jgi:hypothetical protein
MAADQTSETKTIRWQRPLTIVVVWVAVFALLLSYVAVAYPNPSPIQYQVIRVVLAVSGIVGLLLGYVGSRTPSLSRAPSLKLALTAIAALLGFAAAYLLSPARLVSLSPADRVITYTVCLGEYERNCGFPHDAYLYCYENPKVLATPRCANEPTISVLSSHDGNKCGYTLAQILCKARLP